MPTSSYYPVPWVMHIFKRLAPRSVLDVGFGAGRYGFLFREQANYGEDSPDATVSPIVIDGIEVHEPYVTDLQRNIYDHVFIGPAEEVIDRLGRYDMIWIGSVLEHFPKSTGRRLIRKLHDHADKAVVISVPSIWEPQEAMFENPAERHVSLWRPADFSDYPNRRSICILNRTRLFVLGAAGAKLPRNLTPPPMRRRVRFKSWLKRIRSPQPPPE